MKNILVIGAGKIGSLIAGLLQNSGDYQVHLADNNFSTSDVKRLKQRISELQLVQLDLKDKKAAKQFLEKNSMQAIVSSLPFYLNVQVAELAKQFNLHYFDLTEDTKVTEAIKKLAKDAQNAFVPQCGLAPGMVGIIGHNLIQDFDEVDIVKLRVGALPQNVSNALFYALTWSTDGLINEYLNPCVVIKDGEKKLVPPMQGYESLQFDGDSYEAFNTSGGLGSLAEIYEGKITNLSYKTIRYPGHCEKMKFLLDDLQLKNQRELLKEILERAIPKTYQDVVVIYISVAGKKDAEYLERSFMKKLYPKKLFDIQWSAIQVTTAAGLCAVLDHMFQDINKYHGLVLQEKFPLGEILKNRFGKFYSE